MAGIKQIVSPPETFRFPRWKSNINYAKDSVVASNSYGLDSDATSFYIAQTFIPAGQNRPNLNATWIEVAADAAAINAIVRAQLDQDSDMATIRLVNRRLDSETARQRQVDSDFDVYLKRIDHNFQADDSDLNVRVDDADSDIARLKVWVDVLLGENDSDNNVLEIDHDSDLLMIYHDFKAADSDLKLLVDSDVRMIYHDFRAADSDLSVRVDDADSDILRLKVWVDVLLSENDSDNNVLEIDHDSDVLMTYHDFRSADSDLKLLVDSDVAVLYHDFRADDSDLDVKFTFVTHNLDAYDSDFLVKYDSELSKTYHDYRADDSEIRRDVDSDLIREIHDRSSADSDILQLFVGSAFDYGTYF